jgi:hypothetical protein
MGTLEIFFSSGPMTLRECACPAAERLARSLLIPSLVRAGVTRTRPISYNSSDDPTIKQQNDKEGIMLVLSRKLNEKIVIDGNIVVTVVKIDRNTVR